MTLVKLSKWVLIVGGLSLGYRGVTGADFLGSVFGSLTMYVDILVGVAAVYLAYVMLTKKK